MERVLVIAAALTLPLLAACSPFAGLDGEFTITYGPEPPKEVDVGDTLAPAGLLRVSTVLARAEPAGPWPAMSLSAELAASGTDARGHTNLGSGYAVIEGVVIDPGSRVGVEWSLRDFGGAILGRAGFSRDPDPALNLALGLGIGRADLDIRYDTPKGRIGEGVAITGVDVIVQLDWQAASGLEFDLRYDLRAGTGLVVLDAVAILRPLPQVGVIAGWRLWAFSEGDGQDSELYLDASGPLLGLELRY